jgi:drug/metabolite transporter (DMT)-like permease
MSGIRYTLSGGLLFLIFKLYSNNFFKSKIKQLKDIDSKSQQHKHGLLKIITKQQWKAATIAGISLIVGGQGLLTYGEQYLSSNITALLFSTVPIWITLIGRYHYNLRLNKYTIFGIILGSIGLVILIYPSLEEILFGGQNNDSNSNFLGISILLIAAIIWAIGSLYSNNANLPDNILISTGMFLFIGGIILLFISIIIGEFNELNFLEFSISSIFSLLYLIVVGSMGWLGFFWILRNSTTTMANTFAYVSPVIAVFLG